MFGISKKNADITAVPSEAKRLQKKAQEAFSKNYKVLSKFTAEKMPQVIEAQQKAKSGIEQLSDNMKVIIKKQSKI